jgi:hypothetical protein
MADQRQEAEQPDEDQVEEAVGTAAIIPCG